MCYSAWPPPDTSVDRRCHDGCSPRGCRCLCSDCCTSRTAGPVDAAYKAVDALVGVQVELEDYTINRCARPCTVGLVQGWACKSARHRLFMKSRCSRCTRAVVILCSVTEGIEALAVTRVTVRPTGALARQGVIQNAQARYALHRHPAMCTGVHMHVL